MGKEIRAAMAAVAIADATGRSVSGIHSYGDGCHITITADVSGNRVTGHDYTHRAAFSGTLPNLHHYGTRAAFQLRRTSSGKYDGYDYGEGVHLQVTVTGRNATVYDYGEGAHFSYAG